MNIASATLSTYDGKTVDQVDLTTLRADPKSHKIKGSNNGTWGVGMTGGALFPVSMNGPLGYINHPLPYDQEVPTLFNGPAYNSPYYNGPAYNQPSFKAFSGFTFSDKGTSVKNQSPYGESASVLVLNPDMS